VFEVWANLDLALPLSRVPEQARRAEALGYDGVALPDLVHDGIAGAALAVQATSRVRVASQALIAFARSPMVVAVAAWDLQAASGGRFELGLGPQVRANIVDRFGMPWTPPAPRLREYVELLGRIFACWQQGHPLRFEGSHYRITRMQPFTSPRPIEHPEIPIHLAGIGPNMTALAGEVAAGLNTHPVSASPRFLRERTLPQLARGAARRARSPDAVRVWINPLCATGPDAGAVRAQREAHRTLLATLFSTPSYWPALELHGGIERGRRLHGLVREGRWDALAGLMPDELLDAFVPAAPYRELPDVLVERYRGLGRAISFPLPADPRHDAEIARAVEALRSAS
jgi:probable F420-dependent oxidoreductase